MALADRLKGLQKHVTELPPPPASLPPNFDREQADRIIAGLNDEIRNQYPVGCMEWIIAERSDVWQALCAGENDVDRAYITEDMLELIMAADRLQRMYEKAFGQFNCRPPVIERQEALFT